MACEKQSPAEIPAAQTLTRDASGYYCLMMVLNHKGPKAQIILSDKKVLWFTSVRDALSFTYSPEEPKNIAVVYVNDMSNAPWDNPGENNWIDARTAWYVLGSKKSGGMGAGEAVPFSDKQKAERFIQENGGRLAVYDNIPWEYIIKPAS